MHGLGRISEVGPSTTTHYYLADALGSVMALVDSSGNVLNAYEYDVFGAVCSSTGSSANAFTFTGEQKDPNGLEYLRARYDDLATGRFLSRDPLGGGYPYAGGNRVNAVDPTGLYQTAPRQCTASSAGWTYCGPVYGEGVHTWEIEAEAVGRCCWPLDGSDVDVVFRLFIRIFFDGENITAMGVWSDIDNVGLRRWGFGVTTFLSAFGGVAGGEIASWATGGDANFEWVEESLDFWHSSSYAAIIAVYSTNNFGSHRVTVSVTIELLMGGLYCSFWASGIPTLPLRIGGDLINVTSRGCSER